MVSAGVAVLAAALLLSAVVVAGRGPSIDGGGPLTGAEVDAVAARVGPAVVRVEADGCGGATAGSGFLVGGRVVTSGHLVRGAADLSFDGDAARGRVAIAGSLDPADLAFSTLLAGPGAPGRRGLEIAPEAPGDGAPVVIVSRTGGRLRWLAAVARTVDGGPYGAGGPLLALDRPVAPGWSGGPVVDRSGRVVGVVRAVDSSTGVTLAEPARQLGSPVDEWRQDGTERAAPISCKSDHPKG